MRGPERSAGIAPSLHQRRIERAGMPVISASSETLIAPFMVSESVLSVIFRRHA